MSRSSSFVTKKLRLAIYMRDHYSCVYCRKSLKSSDILLSLDHVTPESLGGTHDVTNLVTCCHSCNSKRGNASILSFAGKRAEKRVQKQVQIDIMPYMVKSGKLLKSLSYHEILESKKE